MMRRNTAAAGRIPAPVDPDSISDSGSSTDVPPPQPSRNQTHSVLQVVRADAPVAVEEMTSHQVVEGSAGAVVAGTAYNGYLHSYGRIPMTRSEVADDVDLDVLVLAPPDACRPRRQVDRPVICAYCNCAFCFAAPKVPSLIPGPGQVYLAPSAPITLDLLTPPAVWLLYRGDPWGPGALPEWLLVCSSEHHFKVTMGMLPPDGVSSLVWKCTLLCLRVMPIVVGSEGSNSPDLRATLAPPPEPCTYAGAYWNYVKAGHEDMVRLKLHDDPLKLTLGRR